MDFNYKLDRLISDQKDLANRIAEVDERLREAKEFTGKFLQSCLKHGIDKVSIAKAHDSIKSTLTFPFGVSGSVFAMGRSKHGWPAIWGVVEEMGISSGGGNSDQHQADTSNLIDGVYHFKSGSWKKVD